MTCPSVVRLSKPDDRQELWRLFLQAHNENGLFPLAPHRVNFFLDRVLYPELIHPMDTGVRGAIGVIGDVGHLEGMSFIIFGNYWYSEAKHLEELIVYVDPECRRSDHAKTLVTWMKNQSDVTHLPLVTGIISNSRTEAKCRLYQRLLPKVGEFFLYGGKGSLATAVSS